MIIIPKSKTFAGKRYELYRAFLTKAEANQMAKKLRSSGKLARVWEKAGELHFLKRYHIYMGDKK